MLNGVVVEMKDLVAEVRIHISTKAENDNIFLTSIYPVRPSARILSVKLLLFNHLEFPIDLQIICNRKRIIPDNHDQVWQHAIIEDVWRQPADGKSKVKVTQYTADYFIFLKNTGLFLSNICNGYEIPTLTKPFDLSSRDFQVPVKLFPIININTNESKQHGEVLKEMPIFDHPLRLFNSYGSQSAKANLDKQDSINLKNYLVSVKFSSSYVLPFVLPEKERVPCGSTAYYIKKYISHCSRIDVRFIDLCRKGESVILEDGEKLLKSEANCEIDLEVMRKFDVQFHYSFKNSRKLLQYTVRDGNTTIGEFLEEAKNSKELTQGMSILLSIPGREEMWSTKDLLNSINRLKIDLIITKQDQCIASPNDENKQHYDFIKELPIFDHPYSIFKLYDQQNTDANLNEQHSIDSDKDLMTVKFSSSYVLPFMLPESGCFPCGSTANQIKKYIVQCSRLDVRFIDLCRKGESVMLEDGEKLLKREANCDIDLEVMRKFDVQLHYRFNNSRKLLQYTVRDGNTTIGDFLEEMKTCNVLTRGMIVLLSIPGREKTWFNTDLLNSIKRQNLVLSITKQKQCIASDNNDESKQHGDILKELPIFDHPLSIVNLYEAQNTDANLSEQNSINSDKDLMTVKFFSTYVLPFILPESRRFPCGSTANQIKKYISQCSRLDVRFIDLCRKGESVILEDGEKLLKREANCEIDLEVMRKFDVQLHYLLINSRKLLQYTVRDGNTTIGEFLEEMKTCNVLTRGMIVLLSIPGREEMWFTTDLLNSIKKQKLVLSMTKRKQCISSPNNDESKQHGDLLKELPIIDHPLSIVNLYETQNTDANLNEQDSINSVKDLITVKFSSSYVLPFILPESRHFPCGSTANDIKKYISQCSRIEMRFIDLCRKGESVFLEDGDKFLKSEINYEIDLEVMRKFDVQLHYRFNNSRKLLQYTVRDGNTTIGEFLEEMKTFNVLTRGMIVLLSIPGREEMWSTKDLLNSIKKQKLVLSLTKRKRFCCIL